MCMYVYSNCHFSPAAFGGPLPSSPRSQLLMLFLLTAIKMAATKWPIRTTLHITATNIRGRFVHPLRTPVVPAIGQAHLSYWTMRQSKLASIGATSRSIAASWANCLKYEGLATKVIPKRVILYKFASTYGRNRITLTYIHVCML